MSSKLPSFTASLLLTAYGLDIGGEVHDADGVTNTKDLRYRTSPDGGPNGGSPNTQQNTTAPDQMTLKPENELYHGTTLAEWRGAAPERLAVSTSYKDAVAEASNTAEKARYKFELDQNRYPEKGEGHEPIVVMIKFGDLSGFELEPDTEYREVNADTSWQESLKDVGMFCIVGDIASLKPKFKLVSR